MPRLRAGQKKSRDRPGARKPGGAGWAFAGFLAALFAIKWVAVAQLGDHPLLAPDAGLDTQTYVTLARRVLAGDWTLGPGLYFLSPFYTYFLAAVLAISGSFSFVRVVQIGLGTTAVGLVFLTARLWFGVRAAWIAATLAALTGVLTFYEIVIFQSSLDPFLTAAALYALAHALTTDVTPVRPAVSAGAIFGLQFLNRPNVMVALSGLLVTLVVARRGRLAAWVAGGAIVVLVPIVLRNAVVSHQFALSASQGGLNFYIGNNPSATGQYVAVPGVRANIEGQSEDTRRVAEAATGHPLTDSEVSRYFVDRALQWIRADPAAAGKLFMRKLALVFNYQHQWLDLSYPYYAYDAGSVLRWLFVGPWLLIPLGLSGLVCAPTRFRPAFWIWASFVPFYAISIAIFFVAERYRLPLLVALCIGAGGAIDACLAARTARERIPLIAAAAIGALLVALPFHVIDGRFEERLRLGKVLMNRGDYGEAALELEKAHAANPANTVAEFNLGIALVSNGRADEGIAHLRHAVDAGVPIDGARYALANTMLTTGDRDGAVRLLRTFSPAPSDSAESCYQVGVMAAEAGAPEVAVRYLQRALALRPGWAEARNALASVSGR
jgi:tetratricopeptide (TPR) repeat protein